VRNLVPIFIVLLAAGGCSNPESEAPVALQPGLYKVVMQSDGLVGPFSGPGDRDKEICVLADHAAAFKQTPLKSIISTTGCATKVDERGGNAFSGTRSCSAGMADASFAAVLRYEGSHGVDRFAIDGSLKMSMPDQQPGQSNYSGNFKIRGTRTGDC
jgi:hypothetical protein